MATRRNSRKTARRRRSSAHIPAANSIYRRKLRYEPLEDRRLLALVTVTTLSDTVDFNDGVTSLREAIFATNLVGGPDTIDFAPSLTASGPGTILLTQGELQITDDLAITGPGASLLAIDASGNDPTPHHDNGDGSRVFNVDNNNILLDISVSISGLTVTGGDAATHGGGIRSAKNLALSALLVEHNASADSGAGIYIHGPGTPNLTIENTRITTNVSTTTRYDGGGGIFAQRTKVTISGSELRNNSALDGGGLAIVDCTLSMTSTTVTENQARQSGGGVSLGSSTSTITESTITGNTSLRNGGGIRLSLGRLTLTQSVVSGNTAGADGGGIADLGTIQTVIGDCTISGNTALSGGGLFLSGRNADVRGTTISGNIARQHGGGILLQMPVGTAIFSHSTIAFNEAEQAGGAFYVLQGQAILDHTIAAANSAATSGDFAGLSSSLVDANYSLIGDNFGGGIAETPIGSPDSDGNLIGGPVHDVIDPMLGPLADNGGSTMTHALLPGSPAINRGDLNAVAGVGGVPLFDQRGEPFNRVFNGRIDIGAFEYQEPSDLNLLVDTLADESDGDYGRGDLSLREAIALANLWPSTDTIRFDPALTASGPAIILLTMGELKITDDVSIIGPGAELLTIDASGNDPTPDKDNGDGSRVLFIDDGTAENLDAIIGGLRFTGGDVDGSGGAIRSLENLALDHVTIQGNRSTRGGGGVSAIVGGLGQISITGSVIDDNKTQRNSGGGLSIGLQQGANASLVDSTISHNSTSGTTASGAGLSIGHSGEGTITLSNNLFDDNTTSGNGVDGGGAYISHTGSGDAILLGNRFLNNNTSGTVARGAGAYVSRTGTGDLRVLGNELMHNMTHGNQVNGGGLFASHAGSGNVMIANNHFMDNHTDGTSAHGGGAYVAHSGSGFAQIINNGFTENTTDGNGVSGGGLYATRGGSGDTMISDNLFANNSIDGTSADGGGVAVSQMGTGSTTVINNSATGNTIEGNTAAGIGIHALSTNGTVHVQSNTVINNLSPGPRNGFGGIGSSTTADGTVRIENNTISANFGGISATGAGLTYVNDNLVTENLSTGIALVSARLGGGTFIAARNVITGNVAESAGAGMILSAQNGANMVVTETTIAGNASNRVGGGVYAFLRTDGSVEITRATINNNRANRIQNPNAGYGGGIYVGNEGGSFLAEQVTISSNDAAVDGGGMWIDNPMDDPVFIRHSTITQNKANSDSDGVGSGGGVFVSRGLVEINHTIVAGNRAAAGTAPDIAGIFNANRSLIGMGVQYLGPLADNGGSTMTHALLPNSPAINTGDPAAMAGVNGVPVNDQRGAPFTRVYGGRIDIGAFELQPTDRMLGDFNRDGVVDAGDYVVYRRAAGSAVQPGTGADGNGDGVVNHLDFALWKGSFGIAYEPPAAAGQPASALQASAVAGPEDAKVPFTTAGLAKRSAMPTTISRPRTLARSVRETFTPAG